MKLFKNHHLENSLTKTATEICLHEFILTSNHSILLITIKRDRLRLWTFFLFLNCLFYPQSDWLLIINFYILIGVRLFVDICFKFFSKVIIGVVYFSSFCCCCWPSNWIQIIQVFFIYSFNLANLIEIDRLFYYFFLFNLIESIKSSIFFYILV